MDECREISFAKSSVNGAALGLCVGGSSSYVGPAVSTEISAEVCAEVSQEVGKETTQVVKVPGIPGEVTMACAKGIQHKFSEGYFVSYRRGAFTVCTGSCPEPRCEGGPNDVNYEGEAGEAGEANTANADLCAACALATWVKVFVVSALSVTA